MPRLGFNARDVAPQQRHVDVSEAERGAGIPAPLRLDRARGRARTRRTRRAAVRAVEADALADRGDRQLAARARNAGRQERAGNDRLEFRPVRPVALEAQVQLGEAEIPPVVGPEVDAVGPDVARVRRREDQALGGRRVAVQTAGHRIAPEERADRIADAGRRDPAGIVVAEAAGDEIARPGLGDRAVDRDLVIIDRKRKARDEAGLEHDSDRPAVRLLRPEREAAGRGGVGLGRRRVDDVPDRSTAERPARGRPPAGSRW